MKPTYHQQQQTAPDLSKIEFSYTRNKELDNKFKHTEQERLSLYSEAIQKQGINYQCLVAIEELSELSTILCKRLANKPHNEQDILTEIADCVIMLDIVSYALVEQQELQDEIVVKLDRFRERLNELEVG